MNKLVDFSKEDKNDIPTFLQLLWDYISSPTRVVGMVIFNNSFTQKVKRMLDIFFYLCRLCLYETCVYLQHLMYFNYIHECNTCICVKKWLWFCHPKNISLDPPLQWHNISCILGRFITCKHGLHTKTLRIVLIFSWMVGKCDCKSYLLQVRNKNWYPTHTLP